MRKKKERSENAFSAAANALWNIDWFPSARRKNYSPQTFKWARKSEMIISWRLGALCKMERARRLETLGRINNRTAGCLRRPPARAPPCFEYQKSLKTKRSPARWLAGWRINYKKPRASCFFKPDTFYLISLSGRRTLDLWCAFGPWNNNIRLHLHLKAALDV